MSSLCDIYFATFQHREQNHAWNPDLKTRFDAFGEIIDTPTVEGFDESDVMANRKAQMLARQRVAQNEAPAPGQDDGALLRIRANRQMVVNAKLARRPVRAY